MSPRRLLAGSGTRLRRGYPVRAAAVAVTAVIAAVNATVAAPTATAGERAQVTIAITSVSPRIAQPGRTVTVSGIVSNPAGKPAPGLSVQLWSSGSHLGGRLAMAGYLSAAAGQTNLDTPVAGAVRTFTPALAARSTTQWSLQLRPGQLGIRGFGVYPLAAQLNGPSGVVGVARTFLVFWPGKAESHVLKPLSAAWVWPLIDVPQQAACPSLRSDQLAASMTGNGRLNTLLSAGRSTDGRRARLTWAIDPALISDASAMTHPYRVGTGDTCTGGKARPASAAAGAWLAGVHQVTTQQSFFVTPYADVDVAALTHRGLGGELHAAFGVGRERAGRLLGASQRGIPPSQIAFAWPPNGVADYGVLEGLAANKVRTVILDSSMMPPVDTGLTYTPGAVTSTPNGLGRRLRVLLADHTLTKILGTPGTQVPGMMPAASRPAGSAELGQAAAFAKEQWFLAETAMIAAEDPSLARSVVFAPPRRWDPGPGVAQALLKETVSAPWLRPASLASLAAKRPPAGAVPRQRPPANRMSTGELRPALLRQVQNLIGQIRLLASILTSGGRGYLSTAVAAIESSAWRGDKADQRHAEQILHGVSGYVLSQFQQIKIIDPLHVTLGGKSGAIPVSVSNHLRHQSVRVLLTVTVPSTGQVQVGHYQKLVTVEAGTQRTIKIPVQTSKAGSTTLTLGLATPDGQPLPGESATLTVQSTHFGTFAIVIIVVALVVFLLTAIGRAFRREGPPGGEGHADDGEGPEGQAQERQPPQTGQSPPDSPSDAPQADNVMTQGVDAGGDIASLAKGGDVTRGGSRGVAPPGQH